MAIPLLTLEGNVNDAAGGVVDPSRCEVWMVMRDAKGLIKRVADPDSNEERFGNIDADVAEDGTYTFTDLWPTNAATNPTGWYYEIFVKYPLRRGVGGSHNGGSKDLWSSGPFQLTASGYVADQDFDIPVITAIWRSAFADDMETIRTEAEAARDLAVDISNIDTTDDAIDATLALPGSKSAQRLTATYAQRVHTYEKGQVDYLLSRTYLSGQIDYLVGDLQDQIDAWTPTGTFRGSWNAATAYAAGDQVVYQGALYAAHNAPATGTTPTSGAPWVALPGDAYARHLIDTMSSVVNLVTIKPVDTRVLPSASSLPSDRRAILRSKLPSVGRIASVSVYPRFNINPFYVELWESDGTTLTRIKRSDPQSLTGGAEAVIPLDWWTNNPDRDYYLGFQSDGSSSVGYNAAGAPTQTWWTNTDETSTSLTIAGMTASAPLSVYCKIEALIARAPAAPRTITVGPAGCDYATIQDAIDNAGDSAASPVVIKVYPKGAPYARFSMVGFPHAPGNDSSQNRLRYISLIAEGGPIEVRDDTGDYRTPPAEIRTNGLIKGFRFYATHDAPFSDPTEEAMARRSYAVHLDFGTQRVVFEDCELTSFQAPGAGIGLHQDEWITFRRCLLRSFADTDYGGLVNYGGLFAHSGSGEGNTNQRIELEDTKVYAANGAPNSAGFGGPDGGCAIWLDFIPTTGEMSVRAVGTLTKAPAGGAGVVRDSMVTVRPDSWGNDDPALNA